MLWMGKLTISTAIFHSKLLGITRGYIPLNPIKPPFSYGFPMVFQRVSGSFTVIHQRHPKNPSPRWDLVLGLPTGSQPIPWGDLDAPGWIMLNAAHIIHMDVDVPGFHEFQHVSLQYLGRKQLLQTQGWPWCTIESQDFLHEKSTTSDDSKGPSRWVSDPRMRGSMRKIQLPYVCTYIISI